MGVVFGVHMLYGVFYGKNHRHTRPHRRIEMQWLLSNITCWKAGHDSNASVEAEGDVMEPRRDLEARGVDALDSDGVS